MTRRRTQAFRVVERTATCKRCGSESVAWVKSKKGNWYLAEAYMNSATGQVEANIFAFHSERCGKAES